MRRLGRRRGDEGAVAIMMALITAGILFGLAALVVDLGLARDVRRQAQIAADASALAAGNALYPTPVPDFATAVAEAKAYAAANLDVAPSAWSACSDPGRLSYVAPGSSSCISFDDAVRPTTVRVKIPTQELTAAFATVLGVSRIDVGADANAALQAGRLLECSLCVLGEETHSVGNGDLDVSGGIHLNGGVDGRPNSRVTSTGTISVNGPFGSSNFSPTPVEGPVIGDPLSGLALPFRTFGLSARTDPCTQGPGYYDDLQLGNETCVLLAGLYVVTGTWSLKNKSRLEGVGVTLYATCGSRTSVRACGAGEAGGRLDGKNGTIELSAPLLGPRRGLAVVYDRSNTSPIDLQGNGDSTIRGTVYARSSTLDGNGSSCFRIDGGSVVVRSIYLNGDPSCVRLTNGVARSWELPPADLRLSR